MKNVIFASLMLITTCITSNVFAQETERKSTAQLMQEFQAADTAEILNSDPFENQSLTITDKQFEKIQNEFYYVITLCVVCLLSLMIILYHLKSCEHNAKDMTNASGLTLIIFGTIILVLVVNTSEQLTAAIGILGAIAGYLFRSAQETPGDLNHHSGGPPPKE